MEFDDEDMEVVVLSTQPPELTPSEAAHVDVLRARCRYLNRSPRIRERVRWPRRSRLRLLLGVAFGLVALLLL